VALALREWLPSVVNAAVPFMSEVDIPSGGRWSPEVAAQLEELRINRGWSQAELARQSGVPQPTISRLESGKTRTIDLDNLERLANALGVNAAALIEHVREESATPAVRKRGR
jgi:DNA-binding Xre family transcriptional regulator